MMPVFKPASRHQQFGQPEQADHDRHEADPVEQAIGAEGESRCTGHRVDADHRDQQAQGTGDERPHHRPSGQGDQQRQPDQDQGEEFGWPDP
jgi:hypothetical protein